MSPDPPSATRLPPLAVLLILAGWSLLVGCGPRVPTPPPTLAWLPPALDLRGEALGAALGEAAASADARARTHPGDAQAAFQACYARLLSGLLLCEPRRLDAIDAQVAPPGPACAPRYQAAFEAALPLLERLQPGLGEGLRRGNLRERLQIRRFEGAEADLAACSVAAALWTSMASPGDRRAAERAGAALHLAAPLAARTPGAALGAATWSRGAFFAQAPEAYAGRPAAARRDFERGLGEAGALTALVFALRARFLCTALQSGDCYDRARTRAGESPAPRAVQDTVRRWIRWLDDRRDLLFPGRSVGEAPTTRQGDS